MLGLLKVLLIWRMAIEKTIAKIKNDMLTKVPTIIPTLDVRYLYRGIVWRGDPFTNGLSRGGEVKVKTIQ